MLHSAVAARGLQHLTAIAEASKATATCLRRSARKRLPPSPQQKPCHLPIAADLCGASKAVHPLWAADLIAGLSAQPPHLPSAQAVSELVQPAKVT